MKYAIISAGSKQYQAEEGKSLQVELLGVSAGPVVFDHVLLTVDGDKVEIGTPELSGVKVYGTVIKEIKGNKIQVFKYKSKSRYRKLNGHRQQYALVKIESIGKEPVKAKALHVESPKATREMPPEAKQSGRPAKKAVAKKPAAKKAPKA